MLSRNPLQVAESTRIGDFHYDIYEIMVRWNCGHERELRGEFVRRVIDLQTMIGTLLGRPRRTKRGGRMPVVEVNRRAR